MKLSLIRYWFEFEKTDDISDQFVGFGITACDYADAIYLFDKQIVKGRPIPKVVKLIEDIDLTTLDSNHILPNIVNPPNVRGIWYPMGFKNL